MGIAVNSPYDAPVADLSRPAGAETYQPAFFSISGRIGRARYVAYFMGAIGIMALASMAIGIVIKVAGDAGVVLATFLPLLMAVALAAANIVFVIRRLNDMNRTGWLSLLSVVPIVGLVFGLWILFGPGNKEANKYGLPPCPNGGGVIAACCVAGVALAFSALALFGVYKIASLGPGLPSRFSEHNP